MKHTVYFIEHMPSGKVYVGQTTTTWIRWRGHRSSLRSGTHENTYLNRAWLRHGEDSFDFHIVGHYDNKDETNTAECFYIAWFKALDLSYNLTAGGERGVGRVVTEEQRAKMRARRHSEETLRKMSESQRGKHSAPKSEQTRARMKAAQVGRRLPPGAAALGVEARRLAGVSAEERARRSASMKAAWARREVRTATDETRAKMSAAARLRLPSFLGKRHSEESNEKNRQAHLKHRQNLQST